MDGIEGSIREQVSKIDSEQDAQNSEIKKLDMELTQTNFKVEQRVTVDEGKKIWEHF